MKKTNAFGAILAASILGGSFILTAASVSQATCQIVESGRPNEIEIVGGEAPNYTHPTMRHVMELIQQKPEFFAPLDPAGAFIIKARVSVQNFVDKVKGTVFTGLKSLNPPYIPPEVQTPIPGVFDEKGRQVFRWPMSVMDKQWKQQFGIAEGLDAEVQLAATPEHRDWLEAFASRLSCNDNGDPNMPLPRQDGEAGQGQNSVGPNYQPVSVPATPTVLAPPAVSARRRAAR